MFFRVLCIKTLFMRRCSYNSVFFLGHILSEVRLVSCLSLFSPLYSFICSSMQNCYFSLISCASFLSKLALLTLSTSHLKPFMFFLNLALNFPCDNCWEWQELVKPAVFYAHSERNLTGCCHCCSSRQRNLLSKLIWINSFLPFLCSLSEVDIQQLIYRTILGNIWEIVKNLR